MSRVKRGVTARARHKKILKLTKGQRATKSTLYRRANEAMFKALAFSYRHRRERKGDMRRLWIIRINAAARQHGVTYSQLISGLERQGSEVNRKMLADLAVKSPAAFADLVASVKTSAA